MHRGRCVLACWPVQSAVRVDDVCPTLTQNGWHYLGQQRWSLVDIKSIWQALGPPVFPLSHTLLARPRGLTRLLVSQAQRAIATRAFPNADPGEIARRLKRGQIEQLTIELQQVSLVQPNPGEAVLMKKLRD